MNKDTPSPETPQAPRVWDETAIALLMEQFTLMVKREVRNMKLDVTENIGGMLARRSGIDREIHELTDRVDLLARAVEGFGARLVIVEKAGGLPSRLPSRNPSRKGLMGTVRDLAEAESKRKGRKRAAPGARHESRAAPPPPPQGEQKKRLGRPPGTGRYEAYNAAKRAKKAGGTP